MTNTYIDAHIHLDKYEAEEIEQLIKQAKMLGVKHLVAVSTSLESCMVNERLTKQYGSYIMPCYGFHPEQPLPTKEEEAKLLKWMEQRAIKGESFAVGEIGLPYFKHQELQEQGKSLDVQPYISFLERLLAFAVKWNKPVALHAVYEHARIIADLLEKYNVRKAHFHWYKGDEQTTERLAKLGYMISIAPDVCYESSIQELVRRYPLEKMMLETDGPWPHDGEFAGSQTRPEMIIRSCEEIARIKQLNVNTVCEQLFENTKRFYEIID